MSHIIIHFSIIYSSTGCHIFQKNFLQKVWQWKNESGDNITKQLKRLGTSIDWTISKFTLDEECSVSVKKAFIDLYNSGYIYQDERLVNWDPKLQTAISDLEVSQKEIVGNNVDGKVLTLRK